MANNFQGCVVKGLLAAGFAASAITLGCSGKAAQNAHSGGPPGMPVKVLEARAVPVDDASEYVATLKSRDSAVLMPQVEGQVVQIFVHSGERVAAGSALIEIDPLKQQATVRSQESGAGGARGESELGEKTIRADRGTFLRGGREQTRFGSGESGAGRGSGADGCARCERTRAASAAALL